MPCSQVGLGQVAHLSEGVLNGAAVALLAKQRAKSGEVGGWVVGSVGWAMTGPFVCGRRWWGMSRVDG